MFFQVNVYAKIAPKYLQKPSESDIVLATSQKSKFLNANLYSILPFYSVFFLISATGATIGRAVIKKVLSNDRVTVEFLDYGYTETVEAGALQEISVELANRQRLLNKFTLANVPDMVKNEDKILKFLGNYETKRDSLLATNLKTIDKTPVSVHLAGIITDTISFNSANKVIVELALQEDPPKEIKVNLCFTHYSL